MSEAAVSRSSTPVSRCFKALLAPVLLLYGVWYIFELCRYYWSAFRIIQDLLQHPNTVTAC